MCVMVRGFPAGAFSFEIDDDEIRLIYSNKVIDRRLLPLVLDELPLSGRATPLAKWSSAWYHLLAFDPEAAEELLVLAASENPPPPGSSD